MEGGARPVASESVEFETWVAPHLRSMSLLAGRIVPDSDRDDVVQDALARAWRRWSTFDPTRGSPRGWLLAIVADRGRDLHRRRRRWILPWSSTDPDEVFLNQVVADDVPHRDAAVDLERAIHQLPPRQLLAVNLHYFADLTVADTAAAMSCTEGTVKATLSHARTRLAELLEPDGEMT